MRVQKINSDILGFSLKKLSFLLIFMIFWKCFLSKYFNFPAMMDMTCSLHPHCIKRFLSKRRMICVGRRFHVRRWLCYPRKTKSRLCSSYKIFQTLFFSHTDLNSWDPSSPRPKLFLRIGLDCQEGIDNKKTKKVVQAEPFMTNNILAPCPRLLTLKQ